jgi:hypothetical protein
MKRRTSFLGRGKKEKDGEEVEGRKREGRKREGKRTSTVP